MKTKIVLNNDQFSFEPFPEDMNAPYRDSLINYLNLIYPLFKKAKEVSEFEFISTLIGFRNLEDPGWDTFRNTIEIFENIQSLKFSSEFQKINLNLWLYGHIVEASEPYEILANLMRIIKGEAYGFPNFPDKQRGNRSIPMFPIEKIEKLTELAGEINMPDTLIPINEIYDRELRNAVFHSDYTIYNGGVRLRENWRELDRNDTWIFLNKALAYFEAIKFLYEGSIKDYNDGIEIKLPPRFSQEKCITIVRENDGLTGVKSKLTEQEKLRGELPFRFGRFTKFEINLLNKNPDLAVLPYDKSNDLYKTYTKLRKYVPRKFYKILNKWYDYNLSRIEKKLKNTCANKGYKI